MEPAELSTMLKPFLRRSQKSKWKENHTVATLWNPVRSGLDRFFSGSLQRKPFSIFEISILAGKRSSRSITKRSWATGTDFFHKGNKGPIFSEDLEVLDASNQLAFGLNAPESFANSAWFKTILYFGERGREKQREMKQASWSTSSQASDEKSVHLQVLQILHILCFTDVTSETETHFFLVKVWNKYKWHFCLNASYAWASIVFHCLCEIFIQNGIRFNSSPS